eukprot:gene1514-32892_t
MSQDGIRGHLIVRVEEGSGKTQAQGGEFTWETAAGSTFEAFMKVEIRGGSQNVKAQTRKAALVGEKITWDEELRLEVLEGSNELRLMMCREKFLGTKRGTSVIAACGIFVSDIIDAVPIDKYFELFKPNNGGEGGLIRVSMNFVKNLSELDVGQNGEDSSGQADTYVEAMDRGALQGLVPAGSEHEVAKRVADMERQANGGKKKGKGKGLALFVLLAGAVTATAVVLKKRN